MDWRVVRSSFRDELEKISEVSLAGLSPKTLLSQQTAAPMETPGLQKAMAIFDRAQATKTAGIFNPSLPQADRTLGTKRGQKKGAVDQGKSFAAHTIGGMGVGRLVGEFAHGPKLPNAASLHRNRWIATAAGGAGGALEYARKRMASRSEKTASIGAALGAPGKKTPGQILRATRQVGRVTTGPLKSGQGLHPTKI